MVQNQWFMSCEQGFFCHPLNIQWFRNCLEYSFFVAMSRISLGQTIIALRIRTLGSSSTKLMLDGRTRALTQCSYLNSSSCDRLVSSTSNQLSLGGSLISKNFARATEYVKLGMRQMLWFLRPTQQLKYWTNFSKNSYCLLEMALKSMQSMQAVGSLILIFSKNLLYSRAVRKQPFFPRISMNLNRDMKKLVDVASQMMYFFRSGSLMNSPSSQPAAISQMQMTRWMRLSASGQLPCSLRNSPTAQRLSTCSGLNCVNWKSALMSLEFLIISYSRCMESYFLVAWNLMASSVRQTQNFYLIWKNSPTPGDRTDFFIIFFKCFCIFCYLRVMSGSPYSRSGCHPLKCLLSSLSQLNFPSLMARMLDHSYSLTSFS